MNSDRLERWMTQYGDFIARLCYLYLADRSAAEDAAQEAFLKAWKSESQYEGRNNSSEKTWLAAIAINTCKNYRRSAWARHVDRRVDPELLPQGTQEQPENALLMDVERLPDKLKQAVLFRYYQNLSLEETAQAMGVSRSTAHHRLKKALARLRVTLEGSEKDD